MSLRPAPKDPRANAAYRRAILARAADDDAFRQEVWIRCARDIIWFTDTFAWTYSPKDYPDAPNRPFILYPFQEEAILKLDSSIGVNDALIEKSRDMGASWINLLVFYHRWHFKPRQSFLIGSRKEEYVDKTGDPKTLFWKALTLETPVLTPRGWIENGKLSVGDRVIGSNGKPTTVKAIHDHGTRSVYRVSFNDGTSIRCCGDHLWAVTTPASRLSAWAKGIPAPDAKLEVMPTREMSKRFKVSYAGCATRSVFHVPLPKPVDFGGKRTLPIAPYVLGALLGDGCLSKSAIEVCGVDAGVIKRMSREVPADCKPKKTGACSYLLSGGNGRVSKIIRSLGLRGKRAWEKFIPKIYLTASVDERIDLLRGIMDTDGWVQSITGKRGKKSHVFFETTSRQLADDVAFLVRSLGGFVHEPRSYERTYKYKGVACTGRKAYRIGFICPVNPFFLKRKASKFRQRGNWYKIITNIDRDGTAPVRCITVEARDSLFVADGFSLTHNCDYLYDNLPGWLQPNRRRNDLHMENLDNGSTIDGESTNSDFATGDRRTAVLLDEFAKVHENGHSILRATRDVTKCRIFNSTPEGAAGAFYDTKLKMEATHPERIIRLHWSLHPEKAAGLYSTTTRQEGGQIEIIEKTYAFPPGYNFIADGKLRSPWYDNECERAASQQEIAQELDIDYAASGWQYFDQPKLDKVAEKYVRNPIMRGELIFDNTSRTRRRPELLESSGGRLMLWMVLDENYRVPVVPGDEFVIGADTSMGKGGDSSSNSVASVGNRRTGEKVAQFTTNLMSPQDFCIYTIALCHFFHQAYLIWEDNGPGGEFTKQVIETGYRNVFYRVNDEKSYVPDRTKRMGWWSDKTTKRILLSDYFKALIAGTFINRCAEALKECSEYVHGANGEIYHARSKSSIDPTASGENHGDMVIADALVNRGFVDVAVIEDHEEPEPSPYSFLGRRLEAERLRKQATYY